MNRAVEPIETILDAIRSADYPPGESSMAFSYCTVHSYEADAVLTPTTSETFAYLVVHGQLRVTRESKTLGFLPGEYFFSSSTKGVASRLLAVADGSEHLALRFDFTAEEVISVLLEMEVNFTAMALEKSAEPKVGAPDKRDFLDLIARIIKSADQDEISPFLERHFKRELIYHLVTGPHGSDLVKDVLRARDAKDIYLTNDWIKSNFKSVFAIDELAEQANMSISSFHRKFKAAIGMGPLQCQKQLRLVEARRLMLDESYSVTRVALEVGYESLSQFSRDYRKMFGLPPQKDIRAIRNKGADAEV